MGEVDGAVGGGGVGISSGATPGDDIAPLVDEELVLVMVDVDANRELFESYGKGNAKQRFSFPTVLEAEGKLLVGPNPNRRPRTNLPHDLTESCGVGDCCGR